MKKLGSTIENQLTLPGFAGIVLAFLIYAVASGLSTVIPILLQGNLLSAIAFALCLLISLIEIPVMIFGLRQMMHSATTPRRLIAGTFGFYVMFAAVYASIFVLLTGQIAWGVALVGLCFVRFASGLVLR